jgi:hypothetical protein
MCARSSKERLYDFGLPLVYLKQVYEIPMKRVIALLFCGLLFSAASALKAQVVPSATAGGFTLDVGALGSAFQPDYAGEGIAQTSPNRLYGPGFYVDAHFTRWVQLEAEGHWLDYNQYLGINEHTYMIGPRVPIVTYHKFTPYGKFLIGMGGGNFLTGHSFIIDYGGGVDYRLNRRFTVRCFDFELQRWQLTPTLYPYGASVGISYQLMPFPFRK